MKVILDAENGILGDGEVKGLFKCALITNGVDAMRWFTRAGGRDSDNYKVKADTRAFSKRRKQKQQRYATDVFDMDDEEEAVLKTQEVVRPAEIEVFTAEELAKFMAYDEANAESYAQYVARMAVATANFDANKVRAERLEKDLAEEEYDIVLDCELYFPEDAEEEAE